MRVLALVRALSPGRPCVGSPIDARISLCIRRAQKNAEAMNNGEGMTLTIDDDIGTLLARYKAVKKGEAPRSSAGARTRIHSSSSGLTCA